MHFVIKYFLIGLFILLPIFLLFQIFVHRDKLILPVVNPQPQVEMVPLWEVRSIDTVKYSRDLASEKLEDPSFDEVIDLQVKNIAQTGATHVAIGTPYDPKFLPFLRKWVSAARKNRLNVWFSDALS